MSHIDYIEVDEKVECPICGHILDHFETKEGPGVSITLEFRDTDKFYSRCGNCHNLIEFILEKPEEVKARKDLTISSYKKHKIIY